VGLGDGWGFGASPIADDVRQTIAQSKLRATTKIGVNGPMRLIS
jgi:hypothetical protein